MKYLSSNTNISTTKTNYDPVRILKQKRISLYTKYYEVKSYKVKMTTSLNQVGSHEFCCKSTGNYDQISIFMSYS